MISLTKNTTVLILIFLVLLMSNNVSGDEPTWQLEIELSKTTYLEREPIWLDVTLTNISPDTIRILGLFPPAQPTGVGITLTDGRGNEMPYTGPMYEFGPRHGFLLDAHEQYYDCFDLLVPYNTLRSMAGNLFGLLPPDKYEIQAFYGLAVSKKLTFEVVEPAGVDRIALSLIEESLDLLIMKKQRLSSEEKDRELVLNYPNSVYAGKVARTFLTRNEMLERYPNSGYCINILRGLTSKKAKDEKQVILQDVIVKAPESRSKKFAEQMLRMLEKESVKSSKGEQ